MCVLTTYIHGNVIYIQYLNQAKQKQVSYKTWKPKWRKQLLKLNCVCLEAKIYCFAAQQSKKIRKEWWCWGFGVVVCGAYCNNYQSFKLWNPTLNEKSYMRWLINKDVIFT